MQNNVKTTDLNRTRLYAGLALVFCLVVAPATAVAVVVNDCSEMSLRDAVTSTTTVSGDLIDMTGLPTTCKITLTSVIPITQTNLYFEGPVGPPLVTISGNNASRVFNHTGTGQVVLTNLAIVDGNATAASPPYGGCISSAGSVLVTRSQVTGCTASRGGGISAAGLKLNASVISGNSAAGGSGGGLDVGSLIATGSTIHGNSARDGAGVYISPEGAIQMTGTTVDQNVGLVNGGGLYLHYRVTGTITNSTISGNSAQRGGGLHINGGSLSISNSTISFNQADEVEEGGGLYLAGGNLSIDSTIVTDNGSGATPSDIEGYQPPSFPTMMLSGNANWIGSIGGSVPGASELTTVGTGALALVPLSNHGGLTRVHALPATSPVLGQGTNPLGLADDQRGPGYSRFACVLSTCTNDIGAYERQEFNDDEIFYDGFLTPSG
jgi:hypothetical protein